MRDGFNHVVPPQSWRSVVKAKIVRAKKVQIFGVMASTTWSHPNLGGALL